MAAPTQTKSPRATWRLRILRLSQSLVPAIWIVGLAEFRRWPMGPVDYAAIVALLLALQTIRRRMRPEKRATELGQLTNPGLVAAVVGGIAATMALLLGGLFLIWKSVGEIHESLEGAHETQKNIVHASFASIIAQIMLIDMVFSLDSIITAVGMVEQVTVMVAAVVTSVLLMMVFAGPIGRFVSKHPTVKMLALSFLVAIGVVLIAESFGTHVPKGYIYSAMLFSVMVEMLNIRLRRRSSRPVDIIASIATSEIADKK